MNNKLLVVILFSLLLVQGVLGAGVAPSSKEFVFSDSAITYSIRVFNEDGAPRTVSLEVSGELSGLVSLSKSRISFMTGQTQEDVKVTVLPSKVNLTPGDYVVRVIINEAQASKGEVTAFVGVSSRLLLTVPGEGVSLYSSVFTPNFVNKQSNLFSVEVVNKGNAVAEDCVAVLTVYSSLNAEIITLTSDKKSVSARSAERIGISWTPDVQSGNYLAKAKVACRNAETSAEHVFSVGSPFIRVSSLSADDFVLGSVAQFKLVAISEWGEVIPGAYADVELEKDGKIINTYRSESKEFKPQDTVLYNVFLNTRGVAPGNYKIFINMNYFGKETETVYNAYLTESKAVITSLTGNVIGGGGTGDSFEKSSSTSLLVMAIIIVVILNIVLVVYIVKRKK